MSAEYRLLTEAEAEYVGRGTTTIARQPRKQKHFWNGRDRELEWLS